MNATARENNVRANLQVFVLGHDHATSHPSGIRCTIDARGRMSITSDHVKKAEVSFHTLHHSSICHGGKSDWKGHDV